MLTGTLTRNAESVSDALKNMFGCSFCREDLDKPLAQYRECFEKLKPKWKKHGITSGGKAFEEYLETYRHFSEDVRKLDEAKRNLDDCLVSVDLEPGGIWTAEEYAEAFDSVVIREGNPDGKMYATTFAWNNNIWKTLFTLYRSFPSPTDYMQRMVDNLGEPAFRKNSLRMRILKQMLLQIDFTATDTEVPEALKVFSQEHCKEKLLKMLKNLDESVFSFDTMQGSALSCGADLRTLLRIFSPVMLVDDPEMERKILSVVHPNRRGDYSIGSGQILVFLQSLVEKGLSEEEIYYRKAMSMAEIHAVIKGEMYACMMRLNAVKANELKRIQKIHTDLCLAETEEKALKLLLKKQKFLPVLEKIDWEKVNRYPEMYKSLTEQQKPYAGILKVLKRMKNVLWHCGETETALPYLLSLKDTAERAEFPCWQSLVEPLQNYTDALGQNLHAENFVPVLLEIVAEHDVLAEKIMDVRAEMAELRKQATELLTAYRHTMEEHYAAKKRLTEAPDEQHKSPKQRYHDAGGSWEQKAEQPELLKYCEYLASGGSTELDPYFAKKALYLFAFAFDMTYYISDSKEYEPRRDMEKLLFREFYADNLIHFMKQRKIGYRSEPTGVGINTKNYRECLYVYYTNRKDIKIRQRYRSACRMLKEIEALERTVPEKTVKLSADTNVYRTAHLPALLRIKKEEELLQYIQLHYTIRRENRNTSTLRLQEEANSAYTAYKEILDRICLMQKNEYDLSALESRKLMENTDAEKTLEATYRQVMTPGAKMPEDAAGNREEDDDGMGRLEDMASLITPWLSVGEILTALDRDALRKQMEHELQGNDENAMYLRKKLFGTEKPAKASGTETAAQIRQMLDEQIDSFIYLVYAVLWRLDRKRLAEEKVTEKNVTRTRIIAAYFHYFCQNNLENPMSLEDVFDYFSGFMDRDYLLPAGLQPVSVKNIFDILTIVFVYGYINYAIV